MYGVFTGFKCRTTQAKETAEQTLGHAPKLSLPGTVSSLATE